MICKQEAFEKATQDRPNIHYNISNSIQLVFSIFFKLQYVKRDYLNKYKKSAANDYNNFQFYFGTEPKPNLDLGSTPQKRIHNIF